LILTIEAIFLYERIEQLNVIMYLPFIAAALAYATSCAAHPFGGDAGNVTELQERADTYTNPVLWEDLADNDVFRVGDGE
jgi:hypothetical protein